MFVVWKPNFLFALLNVINGCGKICVPRPYRSIHLEVTHALRGGRREGITPQEHTVSYGALCEFAAPFEGWAGWANEFRNSRHNHSPHHVSEPKWLRPGGTIFEPRRTPCNVLALTHKMGYAT